MVVFTPCNVLLNTSLKNIIKPAHSCSSASAAQCHVSACLPTSRHARHGRARNPQLSTTMRQLRGILSHVPWAGPPGACLALKRMHSL